MNELQTFAFAGTGLRVVQIDGAPWFLAKDVCDAVDTNTNNVRRSLCSDEIKSFKLNGFPGKPPLMVSESGLYKLVLRASSDKAERFQDWVTRVVLPAVRKDGAYVMGEEKVATGEMTEDELVHRAMSVLDRKTKRLTQELEATTAAKLKYQERSSGLEPHEEVGQYMTVEEAAEELGFPLNDSRRISLGQTLSNYDKTAKRSPMYRGKRKVFNEKLDRDISVKGARLYSRDAILRALDTHNIRTGTVAPAPKRREQANPYRQDALFALAA